MSDARRSANPAAISASASCRNAHDSASIARTSAGIARHSLAGIPDSSQSSAAFAPRFATRVPQNARSTRTNIAVAVPRPAAAVRKNVGKWPPALGLGNSRPGLGDKVMRNMSRARSSNLALLAKGRIMMDGMMGMGAGMLIWGIVGILLIVLLVLLIAKLLKS